MALRRPYRYTSPPPPPVPVVARARCYVPDAIAALERALESWNPAQFADALRSARHFIDAADAASREE